MEPTRKPQKKKSGLHRKAEPDLFGTTVPEQNSTPAVKFAGTDNPRYLRVIRALRTRAMPRAHLDDVAGCANGPDLISNLRALGLGKDGLACTMIDDTDIDGRKIKRGVYNLTAAGRRAISTWLGKRESKGSK